MKEFSASIAAAKAFKNAFPPSLSDLRDNTWFVRLQARLRAICSSDTGTKGERSISILPNKSILQGFAFNKKSEFSSAFRALFTTVHDAPGNQVITTVPDFDTQLFIKPSKGATHFRLISHLVLLSNFKYNAKTKKHQALCPAADGLNHTLFSQFKPLGGMAGSDIFLQASIPSPGKRSNDVAIISCLGIEFFALVNNEQYAVIEKNAMQIIDVF